MKLYLATANRHKKEELEQILRTANLPIEVLSAEVVGGMPPVNECEPNFTGNALRKAVSLKVKVPSGAWVLADDSGLRVKGLGGKPGVRSARYAGEGASDAENRKKLLQEMKEMSGSEREAAFHCCLVLLSPQEDTQLFMGSCFGVIALEESGEHGFGYDSLFIPKGYEESFSVLGNEVKERVSHRARAMREMVQWLKKKNLQESEAEARGSK
ncbi:MAG: RdgB/HAM1 family non-canonical purine NTP pyrophosphatase [Opitutales bacterium]|nr:RdgB/HAM1 family non-canonical purine NTP pyrophosphatase [Opitutales bacterium]MCH8540323.1 RdgB/HAM1 family non-canonical purine NTP pyrophosphatase [Opitutales bacterium]